MSDVSAITVEAKKEALRDVHVKAEKSRSEKEVWDEGVLMREELLEPRQLCDVLNFLTASVKGPYGRLASGALHVSVINSWTVKERKRIECWCDAQLGYLGLPVKGKESFWLGPKMCLPPRLKVFSVFAFSTWNAAPKIA